MHNFSESRIQPSARAPHESPLRENRDSLKPNFEVYIESPFYPAYLINRLSPRADLIREDTTTILKLSKQKVAAQLAENEGFDVIGLLTRLTGKTLPQNVVIELQDHHWARRDG